MARGELNFKLSSIVCHGEINLNFNLVIWAGYCSSALEISISRARLWSHSKINTHEKIYPARIPRKRLQCEQREWARKRKHPRSRSRNIFFWCLFLACEILHVNFSITFEHNFITLMSLADPAWTQLTSAYILRLISFPFSPLFTTLSNYFIRFYRTNCFSRVFRLNSTIILLISSCCGALTHWWHFTIVLSTGDHVLKAKFNYLSKLYSPE